MSKFEFDLIEIKKGTAPNIKMSRESKLDHLGKYGQFRLKYLH